MQNKGKRHMKEKKTPANVPLTAHGMAISEERVCKCEHRTTFQVNINS